MQGVQKSHGGKIALIVVACVLAVAVVIGGIVSKYHADQKQWMHEAAYSKEADKIYRDSIKFFDPKAFSKNGIIHSYKVDDASIGHDPMGGIALELIVNDDPDMEVDVKLDKNGGTGPLKGGATSVSLKLQDLLDKAYPHLHDGSTGNDD
ncbi:DUF1310 family protein [Bifidobacterium sp. ESL0728]|uniref:DUF1310 family protein n=1 Tax=Bifidobacterium sp. ESL0728 TaxID=2983220 RepID=UPI0023F95130|nr:DUF1310 family protein [Bifidobacterium sp. ESL0728]WEV58952.1 DUF1310 family protein [Bifidobacterium sp. ESL0728]